MSNEEELQKTTFYIPRKLWEALKIYLIPRRMSVSTWIDKQARKTVGWPAKFSYAEDDAVEPVEQEKKAK